MPRTNRIQINPAEVIGKLVDQAKELTSKPVENISETLSSKSLSHIDEHYTVAKNEAIEGVVQLLKDQEAQLNRLSEVVSKNDEKMLDMQSKLDHQESILMSQVEDLKEDNRACAIELKEMITSNGQVEVDYEAFEGAFKDTGEDLMNQQRAHTVEMDRMLMSLKTSVEKNIEKTKGVLEKKVETSAAEGKSANKLALIISIINLICLLGFIAYSVVM